MPFSSTISDGKLKPNLPGALKETLIGVWNTVIASAIKPIKITIVDTIIIILFLLRLGDFVSFVSFFSKTSFSIILPHYIIIIT